MQLKEIGKEESFSLTDTRPTKLNTKRIQKDKPFMMQTVILFQKKDQVSLKKVLRKLKNLLIL